LRSREDIAACAQEAKGKNKPDKHVGRLTGLTKKASSAARERRRAKQMAFPSFVLCSIIGGKETLSSETDSVGFFGETEIPELSITRVTPAQIRRMFEHHRVPEMPTDFDHDA
jgi:hypothetical protein